MRKLKQKLKSLYRVLKNLIKSSEKEVASEDYYIEYIYEIPQKSYIMSKEEEMLEEYRKDISELLMGESEFLSREVFIDFQERASISSFLGDYIFYTKDDDKSNYGVDSDGNLIFQNEKKNVVFGLKLSLEDRDDIFKHQQLFRVDYEDDEFRGKELCMFCMFIAINKEKYSSLDTDNLNELDYIYRYKAFNDRDGRATL